MPRELMRLRSVVTLFCVTVLSGFEARAQVNVIQEHNNPSRDGVYVDAAFTWLIPHTWAIAAIITAGW